MCHLGESVHNDKNGPRQSSLNCGTRGIVAPRETAGNWMGLGMMVCSGCWSVKR